MRIHKALISVPVKVHQGIQVLSHQGHYHQAQYQHNITTSIKVQSRFCLQCPIVCNLIIVVQITVLQNENIVVKTG